MEIQYIDIKKIAQLDGNPRKITKDSMNKLVESLKINGFWEHRPLALERKEKGYVCLAGNQRLKASKKLKLKSVPCVVYENLTEDARQEITKLYREWKADKRKSGYGRYASTNINEFWAEAVTKAVHGKADKYTRGIKAIVKKYKL